MGRGGHGDGHAGVGHHVDGIACGELLPGARLPSVRELADELSVAPMTVSQVYRELKDGGLIEARSGLGTFVTENGGPAGFDPRLAALQRQLDGVIEDALHRHPAVDDVAVFGVPDDDWGERVHAAVRLRAGHTLTADELTAFARRHLADYKVPREVSFPGDCPRDSAGKLVKRLLRDPYWAGRGRTI